MPRVINLSNVTQFQATSLSDGGYLPGPRIIPNACQVVLNWALGDAKIGHNVLYGTYSGSPALSATVAEAIRAALVAGANWTTLAGFLASTVSLASVTILDVRSTTGVAFTSTGAAAPGTAPGTALPDETAAVITLRTNLRGQSGRGRVYIPGWASGAVGTGGVIAAAAVTALNTWGAASLAGAINTNIGAPVLAHPHRQPYTSPATGRHFDDRPAGTVPITQFIVRDNHWDSQRRRGLK
jgi:hypothetical protein